jgi:hypothetical protein
MLFLIRYPFELGGGILTSNNRAINERKSIVLSALVAFPVMIAGSIDPAALLQNGLVSVMYFFGYTFMLTLTPATLMVLVGDYFYFVKGKTKNLTRKVVFGFISLVSISWIIQVSQPDIVGRSRYVAYAGVAMVVFFYQLFSIFWNREHGIGNGSFRLAVLVSGTVLVICSIGLFVSLGKHLTYRDPIPLGLLVSAGLFVVISESLRAKSVIRVPAASLASIGLIFVLFFNYGFALSIGFQWNPDHTWATLTSSETIGSLIFAVISLTLFQAIYLILRRKQEPLES